MEASLHREDESLGMDARSMSPAADTISLQKELRDLKSRYDVRTL